MKHAFRKLFLCGVLGFGSLIGVPMRPAEIEELMRQMSLPKIAQTNPEQAEKPEWLRELEKLLGAK